MTRVRREKIGRLVEHEDWKETKANEENEEGVKE